MVKFNVAILLVGLIAGFASSSDPLAGASSFVGTLINNRSVTDEDDIANVELPEPQFSVFEESLGTRKKKPVVLASGLFLIKAPLLLAVYGIPTVPPANDVDPVERDSIIRKKSTSPMTIILWLVLAIPTAATFMDDVSSIWSMIVVPGMTIWQRFWACIFVLMSSSNISTCMVLASTVSLYASCLNCLFKRDKKDFCYGAFQNPSLEGDLKFAVLRKKGHLWYYTFCVVSSLYAPVMIVAHYITWIPAIAYLWIYVPVIGGLIVLMQKVAVPFTMKLATGSSDNSYERQFDYKIMKDDKGNLVPNWSSFQRFYVDYVVAIIYPVVAPLLVRLMVGEGYMNTLYMTLQDCNAVPYFQHLREEMWQKLVLLTNYIY